MPWPRPLPMQGEHPPRPVAPFRMLWVRVETQRALLALPDGRRHAKGTCSPQRVVYLLTSRGRAVEVGMGKGDGGRARKNDKVLDWLVACLGT
jgi:hypothetical protein